MERAFTMIREMVAAAKAEGTYVDAADVVSTVILAFPDLDLSREDLTLAVGNEASTKGVVVYFSKPADPDAAPNS